MKNLVFSLNLISAFYMCGIIWIIQIIHYPSFLLIRPESFQKFHLKHTSTMGFIVGPVMVIELVTTAYLLNYEVSLISILNLLCALALWLLTFFVSVPLHSALSTGQDILIIQRLIQSNWPRTILWSFKALLLSYWFIFYKDIF